MKIVGAEFRVKAIFVDPSTTCNPECVILHILAPLGGDVAPLPNFCATQAGNLFLRTLNEIFGKPHSTMAISVTL